MELNRQFFEKGHSPIKTVTIKKRCKHLGKGRDDRNYCTIERSQICLLLETKFACLQKTEMEKLEQRMKCLVLGASLEAEGFGERSEKGRIIVQG